MKKEQSLLLMIRHQLSVLGYSEDIIESQEPAIANFCKLLVESAEFELARNEITDMDYYENLRVKSYCRTALRDLQSDFGFFNLNKNNIDPEKRYHFVMNGGFKGEKNLRNIYMLIKIDNKGYKINFTHCL